MSGGNKGATPKPAKGKYGLSKRRKKNFLKKLIILKNNLKKRSFQQR